MMAPMTEGAAEPRPPTGETLKLRLYITGTSPNSARALANLTEICQDYLEDCRYELQVVDILLDPLRAIDDQIIVTPTLVKLPLPSTQIVGDLSDRNKVMLVLNLFRGSG
jgi:circadian clock protein KaiB